MLVLAAIIGLAVVAVGAWLLFGRSPGHFARRADQNVLLITIDTLRADALGCSGGRAATPNLDALAADGIRFDYAHAHTVVTLPSHTSILRKGSFRRWNRRMQWPKWSSVPQRWKTRRL